MVSTISVAFLFTLVINFTLAFSLGNERQGTHQFGHRINNDRLLFNVENPTGDDGFFTFKFGGPDLAFGPDITYAEITVEDIFNQTHAYISSGGIGEKSIILVLAVLHKSPFSYKASIYGL